MAAKRTYNAKLGDWQLLLEPLAANTADLAHLEVSRTKLAGMLARATAIAKEQAAHRAAKQSLTKELQGLLVDGQRLANLLRVSVKEHYGIRAEKLTEFNLQPFRGRKAKPARAEPDPATPPSPAIAAQPSAAPSQP